MLGTLDLHFWRRATNNMCAISVRIAVIAHSFAVLNISSPPCREVLELLFTILSFEHFTPPCSVVLILLLSEMLVMYVYLLFEQFIPALPRGFGTAGHHSCFQTFHRCLAAWSWNYARVWS